jgi:hypothetical protein
MPASFVYGQVTLDFMLQGRTAKVSVKYRYYAHDKRVEYESIECSNEELRQKIESDSVMRKRVNDYVAKVLEKRDERLS